MYEKFSWFQWICWTWRSSEIWIMDISPPPVLSMGLPAAGWEIPGDFEEGAWGGWGLRSGGTSVGYKSIETPKAIIFRTRLCHLKVSYSSWWSPALSWKLSTLPLQHWGKVYSWNHRTHMIHEAAVGRGEIVLSVFSLRATLVTEERDECSFAPFTPNPLRPPTCITVNQWY